MNDYFEGYLSECHEYTAVLKRIAELETERAALLAEVKRLNEQHCLHGFEGSSCDMYLPTGEHIKPSGDAKRDPISPRDPLERV